MRRFKHSLSHYKLASFDMGELVPIGMYPVLPGDSVQQSTAVLLRVSPLLAPVMHPVTVRVHHWFVPYRLLWDGWEEFITGGPDGEGGSSGAFPVIDSGAGFSAGALLDYLGVPPSVDVGEISALPVRAYNRIFNDNYRDQDLVSALAAPTTSGVDSTSPVAVQKVAWEKDIFTSARPWPQKGPDVTLPLGTTAPVVLSATTGVSNRIRAASDHTLVGSTGVGSNASGGFVTDAAAGIVFDPNGMLEADLSTATAVNVNAVREAFALQRYAEARAQYGSRFTEYLRYLGVRSSDARLQRPEYLGGGKQTIAFSEVLQTGTDFDSSDGVATMRGHGIAAMRSRRFRRFFEEHGVVMTLCSVRPRTMYGNGLAREWFKTVKEQYWQKELELIGQQEVENREVYAAHSAPTGTFGWQNRYAEYRHVQSSVSGEFRSSLLNFWHLARIFASDPTLNAAFVTCEPSKRINAVQTNDVLWVMANHNIQARRMVTKSTIGRIM